MKRYASAAQLAENFGVDASTVWRWVQKKILPAPIKLSAGCSRFDLDDVDQHVAKREAAPKDVTRAVKASLRSQKRAESLKQRRARAAHAERDGNRAA